MTLPFSYYNSKSEATFMLAAMLPSVGMFCYLLYIVVLQADGFLWLFVPIFCLMLWGFTWFLNKLRRRIFDKSPRLTLTQTGVTDHELGIGEVLWADIEGAYVRSTKGHSFICLSLRNESKYVARMASTTRFAHLFNKSMGFTPVVLGLSGVDADSEEVLVAVKYMASQTL